MSTRLIISDGLEIALSHQQVTPHEASFTLIIQNRSAVIRRARGPSRTSIGIAFNDQGDIIIRLEQIGTHSNRFSISLTIEELLRLARRHADSRDTIPDVDPNP